MLWLDDDGSGAWPCPYGLGGGRDEAAEHGTCLLLFCSAGPHAMMSNDTAAGVLECSKQCRVVQLGALSSCQSDR
jgi:hypothetical protein